MIFSGLQVQAAAPVTLPQLESQVTALTAQVTALQNTVSDQQSQITALQSTVSALQNTVSNLQTSNTALQNEVSVLQSSVSTLQQHAVFALDPFVSVDPNPENGVKGPHVIFKGANIHIVSGSGTSWDNFNPTGLGNLIIGYNELDPNIPLTPNDRVGSHNLVIGSRNNFTRATWGGCVMGINNTISQPLNTVLGGVNNTSSGNNTSVVGGVWNTASGNFACILGGSNNTANGISTSVLGGYFNTASGNYGSILGGQSNTVTFNASAAVVLGGNTQTATGQYSIGPQTLSLFP
jgi:hypothetical protein